MSTLRSVGRCEKVEAKKHVTYFFAASTSPGFSRIFGQDRLQCKIRKTSVVPLCSEKNEFGWMSTSRKGYEHYGRSFSEKFKTDIFVESR